MIKEVLKDLYKELPATVRLVAVSKFHPFEAIELAYEAGQRCFAESRPQELLSKVRALDERRLELGNPDYMSDVEWHFIGHLQTNKLKMVLPYVSLVQSVDSLRLLEAIDAWGRTNNKVSDVLIECFISGEESKQGFSEEELTALLSSDRSYPFVRIRGLMGMASFTDDQTVLRSDFQRLLDMQHILHNHLGKSPVLTVDCPELSMGMSGDYPLAIEMGSTMVRIGSMIFGERAY